jgi:hypothetical protein
MYVGEFLNITEMNLKLQVVKYTYVQFVTESHHILKQFNLSLDNGDLSIK